MYNPIERMILIFIIAWILLKSNFSKSLDTAGNNVISL